MDITLKKETLFRLIAIIVGALIPFAYAPFNFFFIPFVSLLILFYLWHQTESPKEAFILGYLFGFMMFGIGVNWLHISINLFGGVNLIGAMFFTYCLVAFISLYPAICGYLACRYFTEHKLLALPLLWLITEWMRGWLFTGFPWLNIGTSQTDSPFSSYTPIVGDYGVSLIVCITVSLILSIYLSEKREKIIAATLFLLIILCPFYLGKVNWSQETGETLEVALIQGAIPQKEKWKPEKRQFTYDLYSGLSQAHWHKDLIVWPETAIPSLYHLADDFLDNIKRQMQTSNAMFMSGLAYKDETTNSYYNSILLINDQDYFYHKHHLVPFGEYMPLKPLIGTVFHFLKIPMSDFSVGDPNKKTFNTDKGVLGMSICYEDAYGVEVRRSLPEANLLVNVSNDAWFGDSWAPHQHLQIARMRALESGRYLLRATNTGISAIIDNKGNIISESPQFKAHALVAEATLFKGATPYVLLGNKPVIIISFLILISIYCFRRKQLNV